MTHLQAKSLYAAGDIDEAWEVAQMDEGWTGEASFDEWCAWMDAITV